MVSWMRAARQAASSSARRRVVLGVAQVVADRLVEQVRVLDDDADRPPQCRQREVAHVEPVDPHARRS